MQKMKFAVTDAGQFEDNMRPIVGSVTVRPCKGLEFEARARVYKLNKFALFTVRSPTFNVHLPAPHNAFCLNIPLGRPFAVREEGHYQEVADGLAHVTRGDKTFELSANNGCRVLVANVSERAVQASASRLNQSESSVLPRFNRFIDLRDPKGSELIRCLAEMWSLLRRSTAVIESSVGMQEMQDKYLALLILAAQSDPEPVCQSASTKALSRVEEFLAAKLDEPVSRAEIAEIAGFSIRSISRGFVKRHGVGPMTFLKQRRLEAVYRELLGVDGKITNVTDVAMKFGFNHLGKFAIAYRQMFGETPSQTLRG